VWNFAGFDVPPWEEPGDIEGKETNFQFNQLLSQDEWFYQEPNDPCDGDGDPNSAVYWLSIAAIYNPEDYADPCFFPWGWKTRPHNFNDDAVHITDATIWPPVVCSWLNAADPIFWPDPNTSWDLSFELTTNEPSYADFPIVGDLNGDGIVDLRDLNLLARNWLREADQP
jgi:hypothetical protein